MELPVSIRALPPEAIEILRYYGANGAASVHADDITVGAGLSDRGFGKAIRRLVTRNLMAMDGDQVYRLTDNGKQAVAELLEYDLMTPPDEREESAPHEIEARFVKRRVVLAAPNPLAATVPAKVIVGFEAADDEDIVMLPLHVSLQLTALHADPEAEQASSLSVENRPVQHHFEVTPGGYTQVRLLLRVLQNDVNEGEEDASSGLYIDLPVAETAGAYSAYSTDLMLKDTSGDSFDL
ncbi:MAG: hypothetical protein UZ15_CFX003001799 [Chloroflexi bacterium OLB15]|nr:MAG: hypothetical protein UZ15_CFX003001799 [Chloroflexi bacterium OLB15]